jgi:hypothetical protein
VHAALAVRAVDGRGLGLEAALLWVHTHTCTREGLDLGGDRVPALCVCVCVCVSVLTSGTLKSASLNAWLSCCQVAEDTHAQAHTHTSTPTPTHTHTQTGEPHQPKRYMPQRGPTYLRP